MLIVCYDETNIINIENCTEIAIHEFTQYFSSSQEKKIYIYAGMNYATGGQDNFDADRIAITPICALSFKRGETTVKTKNVLSHVLKEMLLAYKAGEKIFFVKKSIDGFLAELDKANQN